MLFDKTIKFLFFPALLMLIFSPMVSTAGQYEISRFIPPETCGDCHSDIYSQWENSMHSLAQKDSIYLKISEYLLKGLSDKDEIAESESCVKCHIPIGVVTGSPLKRSDDTSNVPAIAKKGIQCDYCHSATGADKMFNNGILLDPGYGEDDPGIKRGPFKDSESDFHETAYSKFHTGPEICGTCHNVKHVVFKTPLETTYDEWRKGPYNSSDPKKRITCQGCHMHQRPGIPATGSTERPANKGFAADDGPEREHIFTHYFVGGNTYIPGRFNDKTKPQMAIERLQHSASLSIDTEKIKNGDINIKITNTGAGHYLPTGLTNIRQMWLEISVKDSKGKILYSSGALDENGYLPEDARLFNTVFGDGKGKPVANIAKAREVLKDNRIPPLKSAVETFTLSKDTRKNLTVNARLLYRIASQKLLDTITGKEKEKLPVIIMAEIEEKI